MSPSKTLPCHLDTLMEMLNILWPPTHEQVPEGHQMCFYGSVLAFICMQYFAANCDTLRSRTFLLLATLSHPSLSSVSGCVYWCHAEKHKANNTSTLIGALSVTPTLTRCSHPGPPVETVLFDEAGEKGKDSKQREGGYIILPVPLRVDN